MDEAERFKLLGTYKTPRFRYGRKVLCEVRGELTICGLTDAPIPWPLGSRSAGRPSLVVYKDLARRPPGIQSGDLPLVGYHAADCQLGATQGALADIDMAIRYRPGLDNGLEVKSASGGAVIR